MIVPYSSLKTTSIKKKTNHVTNNIMHPRARRAYLLCVPLSYIRNSEADTLEFQKRSYEV